ncbi:helix-turn-helix domain-containing protein [Novosphingobium sp. PS1R-30]|uniref:Helix-turn-helix domain-containing protein n=1 Tax=Novosphingobium anseongense TaxID=3133436 RepID=A0ABU8S1W3_9SPHN
MVVAYLGVRSSWAVAPIRQFLEPVMPASPGVYRVAKIVDVFASGPPRRLSFADIVRETGLKRATCHAILVAMIETDMLIRGDDMKYALGHGLARIGLAARDTPAPRR